MRTVRSQRKIEDLQGEDVRFVDPSSATGYLFGAAAFLESGIDPEADIESIFIGDHGSAVRSMYDGECSAVFTVRDRADVTFFEDNPDVGEDELRNIWSGGVPEGGISISTALPDDVRETLTDTMLEHNGTQLLADDRCPDNRIREVCEITRAPACEE